jgi:hypothetical protein
MVGKQVKSLSVRLEEYEPHFSAAQGTRDFGGHEMRACRRRRHDRHCTSPGKENLDATQRNATQPNEKSYYGTISSKPRREIRRLLVFVCWRRRPAINAAADSFAGSSGGSRPTPAYRSQASAPDRRWLESSYTRTAANRAWDDAAIFVPTRCCAPHAPPTSVRIRDCLAAGAATAR